jgi:hypothetical protein
MKHGYPQCFKTSSGVRYNDPMTLDFPSNDKMIRESTGKQPFHFSGDGIYHNLTIFAETIEVATHEWLAKRQLIEQSTPAAEPSQESEVQ